LGPDGRARKGLSEAQRRKIQKDVAQKNRDDERESLLNFSKALEHSFSI
jgi:hypothetical protein